MASPYGPVGEISQEEKTALLATVQLHVADDFGFCVRCRKRSPCAVRFDAIHQLGWAGVDPREWRGEPT